MFSVTCTAPVNIAVVKYWGKRDEKLILPTNSSISATLHQEELRAKTTVAVSRAFTNDRMWLNGEEQKLESARLQNVLREVRRRARKRKSNESAVTTPSFLQNGGLDWHVHICSENNFPTAAGLASSAAGFACLVFSLAKLFGVEGNISEIARQGSGSACRSVFGGFVAWDMGEDATGSDSLARQIQPETFWPEMRILILVVSGKKKPIGSTAGMQTSVQTSDYLQHRIAAVVPHRMDQMTEAINKKDYQTFAELTMKDSNSMHAVCLDTYPPITYMTDTSRDIMRMVHAINTYFGENKVAYTFDAGPNACLYLLDQDVAMVMSVVRTLFPPASDNNFLRGADIPSVELDKELLDSIKVETRPDALQYVIHTKVGPGPQVLDDTKSLLNEDGMPKKQSS